jgi:WASH complex subunit strumpellin
VCESQIFYGQSPEFKKYEKILFTFDYLLKIDQLEDEIQRNQEILELDENFKETYLPLIERFYILFESKSTY